MIDDLPTLSLPAAQITGALRMHRQLNKAPQLPTISNALHGLFMPIMAYYSNHRTIAMPLPLVKTLDLAAAAIHSHRAEFLILSLLIEIVERSDAASDPAVQAALSTACSALAASS